MRKVIWCCSAAAVLTAGSFLSLAFYACRFPDSLVGRSMQVIAEASVAMQPLNGLATLAIRTGHAHAPAHATTDPIDECIPDDPQPVAPEPAKEQAMLTEQISPVTEREFVEAAPIVINEDDFEVDRAPVIPIPNENADMQGQEVPPKGFPLVMPHCQNDEDGPATPPKMPRADAEDETKQTVFKEWMELFAEGKGDKPTTVEELPAPKEENEEQAEPKCEEDPHLHEHYPGCPHTTCPYIGRQMKKIKRGWILDGDPKPKKGSEESSEEPRHPGTGKEECPRTKGVDTMEYRKSDAGLDEYGPGPLH
jgi:hypothetical protein